MDNKGSYDAAQAAYDTATKAQVPEDAIKADSDLAQAKANLDLTRASSTPQAALCRGRNSRPRSRYGAGRAGAGPGSLRRRRQASRVMHGGSHEAALKAAQGQLHLGPGQVGRRRGRRSYSEIRSPIDGVVTDRPLFAGETAPAGAPLITVMDTRACSPKRTSRRAWRSR